MNVRRTAAASLAAALTFGGASVAWAAESPTTTTDPTTTTPVVAPQDFSVTLAGLGDVVITVDPATGAIQKVVVTPIDGVTAGDPVPVHNGIQIDFTMADGTVRTAILEVEAPEEHEQGNDNHQGPPPISDRGVSEDHRNDDHDRQGPDATTPPTTPTTPTPPTTENHGSGGEGGQSSSNSSGGNGHNGSGGRD